MKMFCTRKASTILLALFPIFMAACSQKHFAVLQGDTLSFYLIEKQAKKVFFATSLDQYQYHPAARLEGGIWEITLPNGNEFQYFYLVDGVVTVPDCQLTVPDDFGSKNCLYFSNM